MPMLDVVRNVALDEHRIIQGTTIRHCVDLSTTGPAVSVLSELQGSNISCLDASLSGDNMSAVSDSLALMVSGNLSQYKCLEQVLTRTAAPARTHVSNDTDKLVLFRDLSVAFSDFDGLYAGARSKWHSPDVVGHLTERRLSRTEGVCSVVAMLAFALVLPLLTLLD